MTQPDFFKPSILTVSELTGEIKSLLEGNFLDVKVEGEVSNAKTSANGHTYFTLKDEDAQLSCVIWRGVGQRMDALPVDGQQIIASGDIQVYPPHGKYQLIVRSVEQAGKGALQEAFEKLKAKLREEGLFEDTHKKPLPRYPRRIGVITSETGAAFHDIRDTLARRWPVATVVLHHASVQGVNAAPELVKAIHYFSDTQNTDLLIVGRGGGSLEDLWPFNEEVVARALFDCRVPTISAVGHEVDFSISDFVADARAATPTQAAILASPDINEVRMQVDDLSTRIREVVTEEIREQKERVGQLLKSHALLAVKEKVHGLNDRVDNLREHLMHRKDLVLMQAREQLTGVTHRLEKQDPDQPLAKGYARVWQEGDWIKSAGGFDREQPAEIEWRDGKVGVRE